MAASATWAALRALMPCSGDEPAWLARPTKRTSLAATPLLLLPKANARYCAPLIVWTIISGAQYRAFAFGSSNNGERAVLRAADSVDHHRHVHVVERAQAEQLGLAAQELEAALASQLQPALQLDVLLGRHGHQHHAPRQVRQGVALDETVGHAQHH